MSVFHAISFLGSHFLSLSHTLLFLSLSLTLSVLLSFFHSLCFCLPACFCTYLFLFSVSLSDSVCLSLSLFLSHHFFLSLSLSASLSASLSMPLALSLRWTCQLRHSSALCRTGRSATPNMPSRSRRWTRCQWSCVGFRWASTRPCLWWSASTTCCLRVSVSSPSAWSPRQSSSRCLLECSGVPRDCWRLKMLYAEWQNPL